MKRVIVQVWKGEKKVKTFTRYFYLSILNREAMKASAINEVKAMTGNRYAGCSFKATH